MTGSAVRLAAWHHFYLHCHLHYRLNEQINMFLSVLLVAATKTERDPVVSNNNTTNVRGGRCLFPPQAINVQSCLTFQHPSSRRAEIKYRTNRTNLNKWTACGLERWFEWSSVNNISNLKSIKSVLLPYNSKITYFLCIDFSFPRGRGWSFFFHCKSNRSNAFYSSACNTDFTVVWQCECNWKP